MTRDQPTEPRPRVALFVTCMVDALYPDVALAAVRLLERGGAQVIFPETQTCCGQPAFNAGHRREALAMARHFLDVFSPLVESGAADAIVAPSGSCVAMVTRYYDVLLAAPGCEAERERARRLSDVTFELTQYLVDVLGVRRVEARFPGALAYHPCCHLLRELGVDAQPRQLLAGVRDARLVELAAAEECCGFGGLFAIKNAGISAAMGRRKARHLADCGADFVALSDVSCLAHLNGILAREGHRCRAVHIAQVLAGSAPSAAVGSPPGATSAADGESGEGTPDER
jgi:L-lactate dehydrogenase complex protein LldE